MDKKRVMVTSIENLSEIILERLEYDSKIKLTVTGNSMYPLFRHGLDSVILAKTKDIKKYDILLYRRKNGAYILHRVVKTNKDIMYMAGDNETVIEYPVKMEQALAVAEGFCRNNKYVSCNNFVYRIYSIIWSNIIPIRHRVLIILKRFKLFLRRVRRRIFG
jgi:hypothetical protein